MKLLTRIQLDTSVDLVLNTTTIIQLCTMNMYIRNAQFSPQNTYKSYKISLALRNLDNKEHSVWKVLLATLLDQRTIEWTLNNIESARCAMHLQASRLSHRSRSCIPSTWHFLRDHQSKPQPQQHLMKYSLFIHEFWPHQVSCCNTQVKQCCS